MQVEYGAKGTAELVPGVLYDIRVEYQRLHACVYIHGVVCTDTYACMRMHVGVHAWRCMHIYVCMYVYIHGVVCTYMYACMCACMALYAYIRMHVCVHTWLCMHIYTPLARVFYDMRVVYRQLVCACRLVCMYVLL